MRRHWTRFVRREVAAFPVTVALSIVYIGLFVVMAIFQGGLDTRPHGVLGWLSLDIPTLVDFGAIKGDLIMEGGEYWRLVTATLLHGSVLHLVLNVLALYQLGRIIEDWYGGSTLVGLHLILGLAGSLASLWTHRFWGERLVQVGGSGAIFGFCAFVAAAVFFDDQEDEAGLLRALVWSLVIGFGLGYLLGADNAAHAGGAIAGAALGCFDMFFRREFMGQRVSAILGIGSAAIFVGAYALAGRAYFERERTEAEHLRQAELREQLILQIRALRDLGNVRNDAVRRLDGQPPDPRFDHHQVARQLRHRAGQIDNRPLAEKLLSVADLLDVPDEVYAQPEHLEKVLQVIQAEPENAKP